MVTTFATFEHVPERFRLMGVELLDARGPNAEMSRSSVPAGYGANEPPWQAAGAMR